MADHDYNDREFKKSCHEAAQVVYDESIEAIKKGESIGDIDDKIFEAADSEVPILTYKLYQLVEALDDQWDNVDRTQTFDLAIRQACFYKASEHINEHFAELGGTIRLEELEAAYEVLRDSMAMPDPEKAFAEVMALYPSEMKELGIDAEMPRPKMGGPK